MLRGSFELIGDKSISHRAIMFSSISKGHNKISNFLMGQDCLSTISCFKKMGVDIDIKGNEVFVKGNGLYGLKPPKDLLDVGNSGTTIRLLSGILAGNNFDATLIGDESIGKRPMKRVTDPLRMMGCKIEGKDDANYTPIKIYGGNLKGIDYNMPVASAQVKSALILASLYADSKSIIREKVKSRNHTEIMLKSFGADINVNDLDITINPVKELFNQDIYVPGDISSAAFIIVGALITKGSEVLIKNVGLNKTRTGIIDVVKNMNGNIEIINQRFVGGELVGDLLVKYSKDLNATTIDKTIIPRLIDEIPVIAVLATQAEGTTIIKDAKELKVKESNRIKSVVDNLKLMGADIEELEDGMVIKGKTKLNGASITTFKDHRIAMAFSIANLICDTDIVLDDKECIDISFPGYFDLLKKLSI
ncbi:MULTISPECIES: 3-phosphoshikimate 1-carboxyvinyltransferase [unclassified Romboutsia]|uniref:3-phosphoshikimate 1-carboxyvinyltransferase n=1 Tax=unclassified Romboutsia TaxID=2626894 RepID=UPI00189E4DBD|nr:MULTISPECIES: 3-phosphoshikimate 1-carboxyvinyltransferase [unclassified Romboutsia]MDB8789402.1 3-phosphoshikimate 1-carboxyvinyltransferase [Romboutsia sp. 1001216sp1]MDB8802024.1 3-phosphoshikimate 1-carboxyvinyltransferase [Romboutsia sp. 1001216sp1]MDB8804656.1 3-phosphoshikimate 1-carboxyvinyltransferase [Romboutsia sp. 1001216sp1]MDB8806420.1 3-phosphoshikimate 1-carboxyvinyltransferase [Romboutsia sp. 1001216sp1]MDB8810304.1 3-phosphoshikimate 1-carboxyvinyltransferase [Romboutsia s